MIRSACIRLGVAVCASVAVLQLAGCSSTIKPDTTAKTVTDFVSKQTGFKPTDVTCPSGVKAEVGSEFDCHFTGPEGPYTAHLKITKVDGEDVNFDIVTRRS
jgi:uncharacterized lipoprotein